MLLELAKPVAFPPGANRIGYAVVATILCQRSTS
jgi:hypothetical protein